MELVRPPVSGPASHARSSPLWPHGRMTPRPWVSGCPTLMREAHLGLSHGVLLLDPLNPGRGAPPFFCHRHGGGVWSSAAECGGNPNRHTSGRARPFTRASADLAAPHAASFAATGISATTAVSPVAIAIAITPLTTTLAAATRATSTVAAVSTLATLATLAILATAPHLPTDHFCWMSASASAAAQFSATLPSSTASAPAASRHPRRSAIGDRRHTLAQPHPTSDRRAGEPPPPSPPSLALSPPAQHLGAHCALHPSHFLTRQPLAGVQPKHRHGRQRQPNRRGLCRSFRGHLRTHPLLRHRPGRHRRARGRGQRDARRASRAQGAGG